MEKHYNDGNVSAQFNQNVEEQAVCCSIFMLGKLTGTKTNVSSLEFYRMQQAWSIVNGTPIDLIFKSKMEKKRRKEKKSESLPEREIFTNRFCQNIRIVLSRWPNATRYRYNSKQRARWTRVWIFETNRQQRDFIKLFRQWYQWEKNPIFYLQLWFAIYFEILLENGNWKFGE